MLSSITPFVVRPSDAVTVTIPSFTTNRPDPNCMMRLSPGGDEFERAAVIIIVDSFVSEGFICTAHGDVVAVLVPAHIYFVTRHAIEVCECALNGLTVDIRPVHESYFQFESKKLLAGFFIPCCSSRNNKNRASSMARAIPTIATTNRIAAKCPCVIAMLGKRPKSPIVR